MRVMTRQMTMRVNAAALALLAFLSAPLEAFAQRIGQSEPGQLDLQEPATLVARQITDLHHLMLYIITAICIFVLALLVIVIVRYNRAANPTPARWTHNSTVEVLWTAVPVVILVIIAIPSVRLLQLQEDFSKFEPDIVIKATGWQWAWSYEYANEEIAFDSLMLGLNKAQMDDEVREELAEYGYPERAWKLATDTAVVVPVNKKVLVQVTASDVIHSWTIPAFGVKADGVPGRINQTWFEVEEEGIYFGQCSELCGANHAYMPITVKAVDQATYDSWVSCVQSSSIYDCPTPSMIDMVAEIEGAEQGDAALAAAPAPADAAPTSQSN